MRADRLVSLVLLLRHKGRMSASALAGELEVSTRTVLRDIEALSAAGVPVYAERGRHGGFALLPGFRTELAGLTRDEALALLVAGSRRGASVFGLGPALASAMRKVADALPEGDRAAASGSAGRLLVDPDTDLLSRRTAADEVPAAVADAVRRAVLSGHRLRIRYAAADAAPARPAERPPRWRTVEPIGLVDVRGQGYLLATRSGEERTYRLSRITATEETGEPARRPDRVDMERLWRERAARFRHGGDRVAVRMALAPERRTDLAETALAVHPEDPGKDGRLRVVATFQDRRHAEWALWRLGEDAEALTPQWLRDALHARAAAIAARYEKAP
ncbi:helix-turn-helix transcriptional regulator [Nocardiopsis suaedae]|uniref:WYL domain-containing protein n=1 Tax=Nocardiopsis suaedae TaxID=3018444 RepID=A0ABT4TP65_9ACTN|nr:WYL domain-containing protein [Nocardiopsis suaedae]MDA2806475.1 WYL domain-containing protein [Nocardiopsis suaedae]